MFSCDSMARCFNKSLKYVISVTRQLVELVCKFFCARAEIQNFIYGAKLFLCNFYFYLKCSDIQHMCRDLKHYYGVMLFLCIFVIKIQRYSTGNHFLVKQNHFRQLSLSKFISDIVHLKVVLSHRRADF